MTRTLQDLLPAGGSTVQQQKESGAGPATGTPPYVEVNFREGGREAKVSVALTRWGASAPPPCPDTAYFPYSRCTESTRTDGSRVAVDRSPESPDRPSGAKAVTVTWIAANGDQVAVRQSRPSGDGAATAAHPPGLPLTQAQLTAIAVSARWGKLHSLLPRPKPSTPEPVAAMTGPRIAKLLTSLLPAGMHASGPGGSDGFGHIVVDDGKGKSLVAANVQKWDPEDPGITKIFTDARTLPDGTKATASERPAPGNGKGAVQLTYDTVREDGFRVVIMAVNAPAYGIPADREKPALDTGQLKTMALSKAWRTAANHADGDRAG
ncbi:hypothetical protein OG568_60625 (plasmid) [Streptomyces sp. NBC_01450]|uniref:hypothetical protein n=1 Tax=Streptomyces sp. NBC_01450 TaxID=2903871 RepID=UPI002E31511B|nr:hypothetical protein [Streptomyces sp. NBC_01450]